MTENTGVIWGLDLPEKAEPVRERQNWPVDILAYTE